jgi:hypothetical protein
MSVFYGIIIVVTTMLPSWLRKMYCSWRITVQSASQSWLEIANSSWQINHLRAIILLARIISRADYQKQSISISEISALFGMFDELSGKRHCQYQLATVPYVTCQVTDIIPAHCPLISRSKAIGCLNDIQMCCTP